MTVANNLGNECGPEGKDPCSDGDVEITKVYNADGSVATASGTITVTQAVTMNQFADASAYTERIAVAYNLAYGKALGLTSISGGPVDFKPGCSVVSSASRRGGVTVTFTTTVAPTADVTPPTIESVTAAVTGATMATEVANVVAANDMTDVTVPNADDMIMAAPAATTTDTPPPTPAYSSGSPGGSGAVTPAPAPAPADCPGCADDDTCLKANSGWEAYTCASAASFCAGYPTEMACCPMTCSTCPGDNDACLKANSGWEAYTCASAASYCAGYPTQMACCPVTCSTCPCADDDSCLKAKSGWEAYTCASAASHCASYPTEMACCPQTCSTCPGGSPPTPATPPPPTPGYSSGSGAASGTSGTPASGTSGGRRLLATGRQLLGAGVTVDFTVTTVGSGAATNLAQALQENGDGFINQLKANAASAGGNLNSLTSLQVQGKIETAMEIGGMAPVPPEAILWGNQPRDEYTDPAAMKGASAELDCSDDGASCLPITGGIFALMFLFGLIVAAFALNIFCMRGNKPAA